MADTQKPDRFESIIKLCFISSSQEDKLSEIFNEPSLEPPTPPDPTQIFMLTLPDTQPPPAVEEDDDDAVFVTPPEHHLRSTSSGENAVVDFKSVRVRVSDEHQSSIIGGASQDGDTVPVCETELIDSESVGNVVLDGGDSVDGTMVVDLADYSDGFAEIEDKKCESRDVHVELVGKGFGHRDECSGSSKIEVEIAKPRGGSFVGVGGNQKKNKDSGSCSSRIEAEIVKTKDARSVGVGANHKKNRDSGSRSSGKHIGGSLVVGVAGDGKAKNKDSGITSHKGFDEIAKFLYNGGSDAERLMKRSEGGGKPQLSVSNQGKVNDVVKKKSEFGDVLKILSGVVVTDGERRAGGSENVEFLDTAKKMGVVFPRPRWWPAEVGDQ